ncbi:hypothetical protein C8R46DRAFT_1196781, partial [Mycena filopes]
MPTNDATQNAALLQLIADSKLTGYAAIASLCVLIYEHLVCFPEEVELIWKSRWGVAKIVYLWNRYFSLIAISLNASVIVREIESETVCRDWLKVQGVSSTIVIAVVDFILMLRVWILYGRPQRLIWLFAIMGTVEIIAMVTVDFFAYAQMKTYIHLGPILKGCYTTTGAPRFLNVYAAGPLVVTFIMFAMTLFKCIRTFQQSAYEVMPMWRLFLRDGVIWFLAVFLAAGTCLVVWTVGRGTLKQLLVVPAVSVYSIIASRTLLNIKAMMAADAAGLGDTKMG